MRLPSEIINLYARFHRFASNFGRGIFATRCVYSVLILTALKLKQLSLQVHGIIKVFKIGERE